MSNTSIRAIKPKTFRYMYLTGPISTKPHVPRQSIKGVKKSFKSYINSLSHFHQKSPWQSFEGGCFKFHYLWPLSFSLKDTTNNIGPAEVDLLKQMTKRNEIGLVLGDSLFTVMKTTTGKLWVTNQVLPQHQSNIRAQAKEMR